MDEAAYFLMMLQRMIDLRQLSFQLRGRDGSVTNWTIYEMQNWGGGVALIQDEKKLDEEWRKSREEDGREEAGGDG